MLNRNGVDRSEPHFSDEAWMRHEWKRKLVGYCVNGCDFGSAFSVSLISEACCGADFRVGDCSTTISGADTAVAATVPTVRAVPLTTAATPSPSDMFESVSV